MIAHAAEAERGFRVFRPHGIHQAGARPIGGRVVARVVHLRARFAETGDLRVDQVRVVANQVLVTDAQRREHARREVRDDDVGPCDQSHEDVTPARDVEIHDDAAFGAVVLLEQIVEFARRKRQRLVHVAIRIADARRLDLDHVGAEIRHRRRARGPEDETRHVEDLDAVEHTPIFAGNRSGQPMQNPPSQYEPYNIRPTLPRVLN